MFRIRDSLYDDLVMRDNSIMGDKLSDDYYIVSYVSNKGNVEDSECLVYRLFNWPLRLQLVLVFICTNTFPDLTVTTLTQLF